MAEKVSAQAPGPPRSKPREGLLVQIDGSNHPWFRNQVPPFTLLFAVDEATDRVVGALFCEKADARSYFLLVPGLVQHLGIPVALCTDRCQRRRQNVPSASIHRSKSCLWVVGWMTGEDMRRSWNENRLDCAWPEPVATRGKM